MVSSLAHLVTIKSKFTILKPIIDDIGITDKISQYYTKWLMQSKMIQIRRKEESEQQFLLLSFIKYQYYIRNDNLIDRFISIIQSAKNSLFRYQKELTFKHEPLKKALTQSLENSNLSVINEVSNIINDKFLSDAK